MITQVENFCERLNKALSIRNMKPVELAAKTGISESTISQYRSGYAKPKEKKLAKIADALRVNPTWLMGLDVPMEIITSSVVSGHTPGEIIRSDPLGVSKAIELYESYTKASPEVRAAVELLLKAAPQSPAPVHKNEDKGQ